MLFAFGEGAPGATELAAQGDPMTVAAAPGQAFILPFADPSMPSAQDLIASGKIDVKAIAATLAASIREQNQTAKEPTVCWRDTYGRGVGSVPRACPPGQSEDSAGLCYDNCRAG